MTLYNYLVHTYLKMAYQQDTYLPTCNNTHLSVASLPKEYRKYVYQHGTHIPENMFTNIVHIY